MTFDIDHNGILHVSAKDLGTGKEQKVRIEASSGISSADVERMRKEAKAHADEDRRKRELIDARNQADQMAYQAEKLLKDNADKLSEADRAPLQTSISNVRNVAKSDDLQSLRRAINDLEQAVQATAQHLKNRETVGAGAASPGNGRHGQSGQGQDDVIDAEFEVKK